MNKQTTTLLDDDDLLINNELSKLNENEEDITNEIIYEIDSKDEDEEENDEEITNKKNELDWGIKLENNEDGLTINEFNEQQYKYLPILDPTGHKTGYYTVHCHKNKEEIEIKENDDIVKYDKWYTRNSCLSKHYIVGKLETLTKQLKDNTNISGHVKSISPFVISWEGNLGKQLPIFDSEVIDIIFNVINYDNPTNKIKSCFSKCDLNILNSYDGKTSVIMDYIIKMRFIDKNNNEKEFIDYFTLSRKHVKILHKGQSFNELTSNASNLDKDLLHEIKILKSYKPSQEDIKLLASKFRDQNKKNFISDCDDLKGEFNNLFMVLLYTSYALNNVYSASIHSELRNIVEKLTEKANKEYIKKNKEKKSSE